MTDKYQVLQYSIIPSLQYSISAADRYLKQNNLDFLPCFDAFSVKVDSDHAIGLH